MDLIALYKRMKKEEVPMRCAAVILAAGNSQRMGFDKMTLMLEGQPVLIRAANSFEQSPLVDEIVVVTREDQNRIRTGGCSCPEEGLPAGRRSRRRETIRDAGAD